jgi:anti-sigma B factor antagonist
MEITRALADEQLTLTVIGKLSAATAETFSAAMDEAIRECPAIILDLSQLDYLASAGIRVLVAAQKQLKASGGTLVLRNVNAGIMEILEVTGLDDVFTFSGQTVKES